MKNDNPWLTNDNASQDNPWLESNNSSPQNNPWLESKSPSNDSWSNFKQTATQIANQNNFPVNVLLGQASLESGRGTSNFAKNRNNYFGYQAYDSNPDAAKKYNSPDESINDYINLIKNTPRYSWAYQQYQQDHSPENLIKNIRLSGYATDPNYVEKVMNTPEFKGGLNGNN